MQQIRAFRRSRTFREAGIVFVHVPKAAGTSISNALYGRFIGHFGVRDIECCAAQGVRKLPRFSVARNPLARLVSAWSFAKAGTGRGGSIPVGVRNPEQYQAPEFSEFDTFVNDWLMPRELSKLDGIFRPQAAYLRNENGQLGLDHLGQVEVLGETEAYLSNLLGRAIRFEHSNRTEHRDFRTYYTPALADLVQEKYREDFELLDYSL